MGLAVSGVAQGAGVATFGAQVEEERPARCARSAARAWSSGAAKYSPPGRGLWKRNHAAGCYLPRPGGRPGSCQRTATSFAVAEGSPQSAMTLADKRHRDDLTSTAASRMTWRTGPGGGYGRASPPTCCAGPPPSRRGAAGSTPLAGGGRARCARCRAGGPGTPCRRLTWTARSPRASATRYLTRRRRARAGSRSPVHHRTCSPTSLTRQRPGDGGSLMFRRQAS